MILSNSRSQSFSPSSRSAVNMGGDDKTVVATLLRNVISNALRERERERDFFSLLFLSRVCVCIYFIMTIIIVTSL